MLSNESNVTRLAKEVADIVTEPLNSMLRTEAASAGWPDYIVDSIFVDFDGSSLFINYPDQLSDEIDDLEYGKPYGLPNPVIRPFTSRSESIITQVLANVTLDEVIEMEGVF